MAAKCECDANYVEMADPGILEPLPRIIWELDEPFLDFSVLPTFRLCESTRERSEIAVSGDGPDHLFGRHYPLVAKCAVSRFSRVFRVGCPSHAVVYFQEAASRATRRSVGRPTGNYSASPIRKLFAAVVNRILSPEVPRSLPDFDRTMDCDLSLRGGFDAMFDRMVRLDLLVDGAFGVFRKVGCMSRGCDLSVREPFLDRRILDIGILDAAQEQGGRIAPGNADVQRRCQGPVDTDNGGPDFCLVKSWKKAKAGSRRH